MFRPDILRSARRQAGATQLETLGVILVIGILVAAGAAALYTLSSKGSQADDTKNIQLLIANIRDTRDIDGYGTGDLLPSLITGKNVPTNMTISGNSVANAWGGAVTVTGSGLSYTVSSAQVPQSECIKEAMAISRGGRLTTSINGGSSVSGPMTKAQATTGCSSDSNTIAFTSNS